MKADGRELSSAVVRTPVCAEQACHRANRHDMTLAGFYHVGHESFHRLKCEENKIS